MLAYIPIIVVAPLINLIAYAIIWLQSGLVYSVSTLGLWLVIGVCMGISAKIGGIIKLKEGASNDER